MKMKSKKVTLIEVDYNELDKQVNKFLIKQGVKWKHAGDRFECIAEEEWGNDQSHSFDVDGKIDADDKKRILGGEFSWQTGAILNWMAAEGEIPKGEYKIDVCW